MVGEKFTVQLNASSSDGFSCKAQEAAESRCEGLLLV